MLTLEVGDTGQTAALCVSVCLLCSLLSACAECTLHNRPRVACKSLQRHVNTETREQHATEPHTKTLPQL
eukprot:115955-Rhodomonas_salina.1